MTRKGVILLSQLSDIAEQTAQAKQKDTGHIVALSAGQQSKSSLFICKGKFRYETVFPHVL